MLVLLPFLILFITSAAGELRPWLKTPLGPREIPKEKLSPWSKVYQEHIQGHYKSYVNLLAEKFDRGRPYASIKAEAKAINQAKIQLRAMVKTMLKKCPKGRDVTSNPENKDQDISDAEVDDLLSDDTNAKEMPTKLSRIYQQRTNEEDTSGQVEFYVKLLAEQMTRGRWYESKQAKEKAREQTREQVRQILKGLVKECQRPQSIRNSLKDMDQEILDLYDLLCEDAKAREEDVRKKTGSPGLNLGSAVARAKKALEDAGNALNAVKKDESFPGNLNKDIHSFTGIAGLPRMGPVYAW
ncbi:MAG: hypothetical protein M1816_006796 [Peltula sp. TS41687]|nr:MAG: hypothetical protein M1816_006796 [Peltula sp. TS41687]